jgi:LacI family transcriptional regulator
MSDVARHAGVAIGTVSNTLNNPEKVSERTRRKVLGAIAELGFVRNDAARSLAVGTSTTIGLVLADLGNSFFVDIARGVEQVMRRRGFDVLIANTEIDRDREVRNLELFERSRVAGILFAPLDTPLAHSGVLPIRSTPTVLVNFTSDTNAYPSVAVDEQRGGALAASHVIERGARRILFVGGPLFLTAVGDRYKGASAEVDRAPGAHLELLETRGLNIRHGRQAAELILERGAGTFDAIVAASDLLAMGIVQVLADLPGFSVPADVMVTGYDNNHFASESSIPISTVSQPGEEMGRTAADLLLEKIENPGVANRSVVLSPHLVPRRSTLGDTWRRD